MRLCEHQDFQDAILRAEQHFQSRGLRAAIVEKDYYVTEALRELAHAAGPHIIFKGGTSLSKGWGLIDRFSEDIDLFLDPRSFEPPLGAKRIDKKLAELRDTVARVPGLVHDPDESEYWKGKGRNDHFTFTQRFGAPGEVAPRVLLESGIASGREPTEERTLSSYLAQFLRETGASLQASDEQPFVMKLLHFRRTFVEKLFAIHAKVEQFKKGAPLGPYARHYYDLHQLADRAEVLAMLQSPEFREIQTDYDAISRKHFRGGYIPPADMDFSKSDALFPAADLSKRLEAEYEGQCHQLCYSTHPSWSDVLTRFEALRALLRGD